MKLALINSVYRCNSMHLVYICDESHFESIQLLRTKCQTHHIFVFLFSKYILNTKTLLIDHVYTKTTTCIQFTCNRHKPLMLLKFETHIVLHALNGDNSTSMKIIGENKQETLEPLLSLFCSLNNAIKSRF